MTHNFANAEVICVSYYLGLPIKMWMALCRRISVELFAHTLNLDLKFHLMRKTGEVTRVLDRGTAAVQNVLSTVIFSIGPSIFDIFAASAYVATQACTQPRDCYC